MNQQTLFFDSDKEIIHRIDHFLYDAKANYIFLKGTFYFIESIVDVFDEEESTEIIRKITICPTGEN